MVANGSGTNGRSLKSHSALQAQIVELKSREKSSVAEHFYDLMLESCERLFENDIEPSAFEDQMRYMFGIKVCSIYFGLQFNLNFLQEAYKLFTIDKLIGSIIKQVRDRH